MRLVLIGGNPKGYSVPFHPSTLSGKRIREIISRIGLSCELEDMTANSNDKPSIEEIKDLQKKYEGHQVVFLGRFVERALREHFPDGIYLPHPASRRVSNLERLATGLEGFLTRGDNDG